MGHTKASSSRGNVKAAAASDAAGGPAQRPSVFWRAVLLGLGVAVTYGFIAGNGNWRFTPSMTPYHILTADAMLHGRLSLREDLLRPRFQQAEKLARQSLTRQLQVRGQNLPPEQFEEYIRLMVSHDLAVHEGRYYTYWGPLTAVAMLPWVAMFGPDVSDNLINALVGALNVALMYWVLRRVDRAGLRRLGEPCCIALTLLLAFGTVHFYLACNGRVWHAVQIVTLTPLLLSLVVLLSRRNGPWVYALSGALFGASILGRNVVAAAGLFHVIVIWLRQRGEPGPAPRRFVVRLIAFVLPLLATAGVQMAYNYGRFDDPFETGQGITVHTGGEPRFRADYDRYGSFHPVYLAKNLKHYLWHWQFPVVNGVRTFEPEGNSMFLITPPLLFLFVAWRRWDGFTLALLCGALPPVVALLLFRATGYSQFGNRYLLDAMPLLLLLVATGMNGRVSPAAAALIAAAVVMNTFGTLRFYGYSPTITNGLFLLYWAVLIAAGALAVLAPASRRGSPGSPAVRC